MIKDMIKDIIKGHVNEALDKNSDISKARLEICEKCPIYVVTKLGPNCSNKLWIDPKTEKHSSFPITGYVRGCGCRLAAKTRLEDNHCIIGKW